MRILTLVSLGLLIFAGPTQSQPLSIHLQSVLASAAPAEKIPVIIELGDQADIRQFARAGRSVRKMTDQDRRRHRSGLVKSLRDKAERSQGELAKILRQKGVKTQKSLWINNSIAAEVRAGDIPLLAARPEIAGIRIDAQVYAPIIVPAATAGIEDNLHRTNVPDLWALGLEGQGQVVALLDTGVSYQHQDLNATWRGGDNSWYNPIAADCALNSSSCTSCDFSATVPCDYLDEGEIAHGTGVAGILVGGDAGGTSIGVAPQAQWIAAKIFKSNGTSKISNIHLAFQWVLDPDGNSETDDAPDVVNSSWSLDSFDTCSTEYLPDVIALRAAGIAPVFAAGNITDNTPDGDVSPANYAQSLAVGSLGSHASPLEISDFSRSGPSSCTGDIYPDLVAPGFGIITAGGSSPSSYIFGAGTSFSAPHVSGIITLLMQAFPDAALGDIEDALLRSARDLGASGADNDYGYGMIDALAAYNWMILAGTGNRLPPAPSLISPAAGQADLDTTVKFTWRQLPDANADKVINRLYYSTDPSFADVVPIQVASDSVDEKVLPAGLGAIFLGGLLLVRRGHTLRLKALLFAVILLLLFSCSGGGGTSNSDNQAQLRSSIQSGLSTATTYYWKVTADDGKGEPVESEVAQFMTK